MESKRARRRFALPLLPVNFCHVMTFFLPSKSQNKRVTALHIRPRRSNIIFEMITALYVALSVTVLSRISHNFVNRYSGLQQPRRSFLRPYLKSVTSICFHVSLASNGLQQLNETLTRKSSVLELQNSIQTQRTLNSRAP